MIMNAKGGEWIIGADGARYLVLERYPDLALSMVDLANGRILRPSDVFTEPETYWEKQVIDVYVTYVCRTKDVRHCA